MGVLEIKRKETPNMTRKGMARLFSFNKTTSSLSSSSFSIPRSMPPSPHRTFSESMMEETLETAEATITKWDLDDASSFANFVSLFQKDRKEAKDYIKCIKDLRRAMHFLVSVNSGSYKLVLAQNFMQIAMKRLEKEFYRILSANRRYLDPESVSSHSSRTLEHSRSGESDNEDCVGSDEVVQTADESICEVERLSELAMSDLKLIADCMIISGYGKECVKIYKIIRTSIVEEQLYHLGIGRYNSSMINQMNSEAFEQHIKNWLNVIRIAMKTLFYGERLLCDHVFSASNTIRESCFTDVTRDGAINLFRFPELIGKRKSSPEKIFRLMDLYESISGLWSEIESIFSFQSTSTVKLQALNSLIKLGDSVRIILSEFELSIEKNSAKTLVAGGGIHPMTNSVMNYVSLLANYSGVLTDIVADSTSPTQSRLLETYFESMNSDESPTPTVSVRLAWIVLMLLCKLDSKAKLYNDIALSYLFLANNLQFAIEKVRTTNLKYLLGDHWVAKHEKTVKQYAANYEAMDWTKVFSTLPKNSSDAMSPETVKGCFSQFNLAFEEVYRKQMSWVVPDRKLRDEIKVSIAKKLVPAYRKFYDTYLITLSGERNLEVLVRFSPDNLGNYLSDLFHGTAVSGSSSSSSSS
ncbi:unnamed protein product [Camellia sinensis]